MRFELAQQQNTCLYIHVRCDHKSMFSDYQDFSRRICHIAGIGESQEVVKQLQYHDFTGSQGSHLCGLLPTAQVHRLWYYLP